MDPNDARAQLWQAIVETDRRVEEEPDLDRRAGILEAALDRYPGEPHFEQALRQVRDKRDLVDSIVGKARFFEGRGQRQDALDQWRMLQSIHPRQPGLASEIERLSRQTAPVGLDPPVRALDCLVKAQELTEKGAHDEALAAVREAHALDPRNAVICTVLANSLAEQARRVAAADPKAAQSIVDELLALDPNYPTALIFALPPASPEAPPAEPSRPSFEEALPLPVPLPLPARQPESLPPAQLGAPMDPQMKKLLLGTGAAAVVLLAVALLFTATRHGQKAMPAAAAKYSVLIHSTQGAEIKLNGDICGISDCRVELAAGSYPVEAKLTGFQTAASSIKVAPGATDFTLGLAPVGPRVAVFTDLTEGTVSLDETPAAQIQGGGAEVSNLSAGKHVLAVKSGDSAASIPVEIVPGAEPRLAGPLEVKNLRCFLVAGYGAGARVYGNSAGYRVTLDGKPAGTLAADGMPLAGLAPGTHELAFDNEGGQHDRIVFEAQPSATLYVSLGSSQNVGVLFVDTNQDQAQLYIDGQRYKRDTTRGRLLVYLPPKKYSVVVQKEGFAPSAAQTVEIKRGVETRVSFNLSMARASLAVHHAPPATDVLVDGIQLGATHPDGEFQVGGIDPGRHTVGLHKDKFKPVESEQIFLSGKTVELEGALEALVATGTLKFDVTPAQPEAHVRIQRDGDPQDHEVTGAAVTVPEGRYTVTVSAPQYVTTSTALQVNGGATVTATVALRREATRTAAKTVPETPGFGLQDWMQAGGWVWKVGVLTRRGGDWVLAPPEISQGTVRFTVVSIKGRRVEWAVGFHDARNYLIFELDDKNLTRYAVHNGGKSAPVRVAHELDKKKPMGFSLAITPLSVVVSVNRGSWHELDRWEVAPPATQGKFGFHIPGSDEIGLEDFKIGPN